MTGELDRQISEIRAAVSSVIKEHGALGRSAVRTLLESELAPKSDRTASLRSRPELVDRSRYANIIGDSPAILEVFSLLDRVSASNVPVLIQGESGTGKELIAAAIHKNSNRNGKSFVTENCAAIPETLQESELFGYKKGAFTGADRERKGLFQIADKGTLFLDEVGDMSLAMQKKLLRVLQDGEVRPVGGSVTDHVDVRVLSASNRLLTKMVEQKLFREDLYYRLNGLTIQIPPLRERAEDIPMLVQFFLKKVGEEMGVSPPEMSAEAAEALVSYRWPGNVRELENEIRRCLALLGPGGQIGVDQLSDEVRGEAS